MATTETTSTRPLESELRAFPLSSMHWNDHGVLFFELTDDTDTNEAIRNRATIEGNILRVEAGLTNPSSMNPGTPIEVRGPVSWWKWPREHVKAIWGKGKILWVNKTHYPLPEKPKPKLSSVGRSIRALTEIVEAYQRVPSYRQSSLQLHWKEKLRGAMRMLPSIDVPDDQWNDLLGCVRKVAKELYVPDDDPTLLKVVDWIESKGAEDPDFDTD